MAWSWCSRKEHNFIRVATRVEVPFQWTNLVLWTTSAIVARRIHVFL
ncbi:hypothetical protein ZEAMMB73_Zm00001d003267 [Zea mays]|uniref:Uncharacterized protein n=1 Tax=Zea mays TaxID=4577 RepID=A0A1D6E8A1_MAIZE|nr:hypothetical protein ZEAMMB73_Zm00001d003267 [Zea mays]